MMPTYTYECVQGHVEEHFASMSAPPLIECPRCGAETHRIVVAPPIVAWGPERFSLRGIDRTPPTKVFQTDKRKKRAK